MKNVKFSLSSIEGKLSRVEMKQILGGSAVMPRNDCDKSIPEYRCQIFRRCYEIGRYIGCKRGDYFPI